MLNFKLSLARARGFLKRSKFRINNNAGYLVLVKTSLKLNGVGATSPKNFTAILLFSSRKRCFYGIKSGKKSRCFLLRTAALYNKDPHQRMPQSTPTPLPLARSWNYQPVRAGNLGAHLID